MAGSDEVRMRRPLACLTLLLCALAGAAEENSQALDPKVQAVLERAAKMEPRQGVIPIEGANASLKLTEAYRFLGPEDASFVLCDAWGNPPGIKEGVKGMLVPKGFHPYREGAWAVVIRYEACGYVKDDDAGQIDAAELRKGFIEAEEEHNPERVKAGYDELWMVDWAEAPRYDKERHIIFWAKRMSSKREGTDEDSLNYEARCLGRRGLLSLNAIGNMAALPQIKGAMDEVIAQAQFSEGERYVDFNEATDHVAEYTVLSLVAAGTFAKLAAKGGLLLLFAKFGKFLIIPLVFLWKYIAAGARWVWRKVRGERKDEPGMLG